MSTQERTEEHKEKRHKKAEKNPHERSFLFLSFILLEIFLAAQA